MNHNHLPDDTFLHLLNMATQPIHDGSRQQDEHDEIDADTFEYVFHMLQCSCRGRSLLPELCQHVSADTLLDLAEQCTGQTMRFPTRAELVKDLLTAKACYLRGYDQRSWRWVQEALQLNPRQLKSVQNRYYRLRKFLQKNNFALPWSRPQMATP